ncbi:PLP-dependent cysteine synthase family protein [Ectobacillus polymachus]|uniref:PLP-dependent cysteine synthase family protein n=1 Tax=Ectobacillus polymachus TaxID=1508806 RepID=UPI003A8ADE1C
MNTFRGVHELIGNTPLVEITRFSLPKDVRIFAKLEYFNPGGSIKDRLGKHMIEVALEKGLVKHGGTIIEPTAGNTGIGLALAAIQYDIHVIVCVPEKFSIEKQELMRALGATVINTPTEEGMTGAIAKAKGLLQELPNSYCPQQFANSANPETYFKTIGPEIWTELDGRVDIFVAGAGTGGTFMGTATYLQKQNPNLKCAIVEPVGSILNGGESGSHETEGIGMEFLPPFMNTNYFHSIHTVSDHDAFHRVKELAKLEGLLVGSSSGAAFHASLREAESAKPGTNIVTIFPDSSERYLSKDIYKGWD